jgi:hypothetical protein
MERLHVALNVLREIDSQDTREAYDAAWRGQEPDQTVNKDAGTSFTSSLWEICI